MKRIVLFTGLTLMMASLPVARLTAQSADPGATAGPEASDTRGQDASGDTSRVHMVFKHGPSLRVGKVLRIDLRVRLQADVSNFSSDAQTDQGLLDVSRRRVGIEGKLLKRVEFQLERELGQNDPWRDVFVDVQPTPHVQFRGGKFKIPFSLDQLTSPTRLDFVYRSRIGDYLAPGRDRGVAVHGRFKRRGLSYEAGLFQHDGDNARFGRNPGAGRTMAGRVTVRPFDGPATSPGLKQLELAADMTVGQVAEGLNALRGRTTSGTRVFEPVYVNGQRTRLGLDAQWSSGPFSLKGEVLRASDERRRQGLAGENLPPLLSRGWYASGSWTITPEPNGRATEPSRPLTFRHGGIGVVELAARYERISFESADARSDPDIDPPSRSPRATNLVGASDRIWTFGVNWSLNRWVKLQIDAVRERLGNSTDGTGTHANIVWGSTCRLQFVL